MAEVESYTIPAMTTVTFTLDLEEAAALRDLLRWVGGSATASRRRHTIKILDALLAVPELRGVGFHPDINGGITFTDDIAVDPPVRTVTGRLRFEPNFDVF